METSTPRYGDRLLTPISISDLLSPLDELRSPTSTPLQSAADLLVLLSPSDRVFESSPSTSDLSSIISIPFSDPVPAEYLRKEAARAQRLVNEELMTFSPEYKRAMVEYKEGKNISLGPDDLSSAATMMAEDLNTIMQEAQKKIQIRRSQPPPPPSSLLASALENLERNIEDYHTKKPEEEEDEESDSYDEDDEEEEGEGKPEKPRSRKASKSVVVAARKSVIEDEEYYDTTSGMWRMMSAYDDLVLSQPGYKENRQDDSSWLETEPVPWKVMEESRSKCLEWLEKNQDQAGL